MNKKFLSALLVFFFAGIVLIGVLGGCNLDYALNKVIVDSVPASSLQWWQTYTYRHYLTWIYVYDPSWFTTILVFWVIMAYIISCIGFVFFFHDKGHPLFDDSEFDKHFKNDEAKKA